MGIWDDLTGKSAADASKAAAADTYKKQQDAIAGINKAGDQYATGFADLARGYAPWQATGQVANDAVRNLLADPSSIRSLPGYQTGVQEGTRAIDHSAVGNGSLFSGKTGKDLTRFGEGFFDKTYGEQLSRLLGVSSQGLGATQAGINTTGQGLTGQLGARTSAYNGGMQSAGTIGQGDIAAANARMKGTQGLLNFAGQLGGQALSMGMGGGGGISSLIGSSPQYGGGNYFNSEYGGSSSNPLPGLSADDYGYGY